MKQGIRIVVVLLLVVVGASQLFGAGAQEGGGGAADPLIWYVPGGAGFPYDETEEAAVYAAFNELLLDEMGMAVDIRVQGGFSDYNETMPLILASGEDLDIVWTAIWSNNFLQNASDGFYAGLDDLLEEHGQDILADTRAQLEATRVNGEIRGVWSQQIAAYNTVARLRMDIVDEQGWNPSDLSSFADLKPWLEVVKDEYPELTPFGPSEEAFKRVQPYYNLGNFGILEPLIGHYADDPNVEVLNLTRTPEFREFVEMMREWYLAGYIPEDGLTYTGDQWRQLRNQNQLFSMPHNTYNPQNAELEIDGITSRDWRLGSAVTLTGNITSTLNAVSSQSDRQVEAVQFLNWLWTSEPGYNMLVWGLEGRHYERLDDSHIRPDQDSGYYTNLPWMYGNTFRSYLLPNQEEDLFERVSELNESSLKATSLGFVPDTDEIRTLVASVSAVLDQYMVPITGGYVDPDESIPEFHAALDRAGMPDLIDALQAQVDEWLASNR